MCFQHRKSEPLERFVRKLYRITFSSFPTQVPSFVQIDPVSKEIYEKMCKKIWHASRVTPTIGINRKYGTSQKHFLLRSFVLFKTRGRLPVRGGIELRPHSSLLIFHRDARSVTPGIAWHADWAHLEVCCRELATYCVRDVVCQVRILLCRSEWALYKRSQTATTHR